MLAGSDDALRFVLKGAAANLLDKFVLFACQLTTVGVMAHFWSLDTYGLWLLLIAVATYLTLGEGGFINAASTDIALRIASSDLFAARSSATTAWTMVTLLSLAVTAGALAVASGLEVHDLLDQQHFSLAPAVGLWSLATVQFTFQLALLRGVRRQGIAGLISALVAFSENAAVWMLIVGGGGLQSCLLAQAGVRLGSTVVAALAVAHNAPWAGGLWLEMDGRALRRLMPAALASFIQLLGSAVAIQGPLLVAGWFSGPSVVAMFGVTRTLCRMPLQFCFLLLRASYVELTHALWAHNGMLASTLLRWNLAVVALVSLVSVVGLGVAGPFLAQTLTGHQLNVPHLVFVALCLSSASFSFWQVLTARLFSWNRHCVVSAQYLLISLASVTAAGVILYHWSDHHIYVVCFSSLFADLLLLGFAGLRLRRRSKSEALHPDRHRYAERPEFPSMRSRNG